MCTKDPRDHQAAYILAPQQPLPHDTLAPAVPAQNLPVPAQNLPVPAQNLPKSSSQEEKNVRSGSIR